MAFSLSFGGKAAPVAGGVKDSDQLSVIRKQWPAASGSGYAIRLRAMSLRAPSISALFAEVKGRARFYSFRLDRSLPYRPANCCVERAGH